MRVSTGKVRARLQSAIRNAIPALITRSVDSPSRATTRRAAIEPLEGRTYFGGVSPGLSQPIPLVPCTTCPPSPIMSGGPGNGGPGGSGPGGPNGSGPGQGGSGSGGAGGSGSGGYQTEPIVAVTNGGNLGSSETAAPILSFSGAPIIQTTDLESDGFGFAWGITRSWTGLSEAGPVGNGWAVTQLPYIVAGGLPADSTDPYPSAADNGTYPDMRLDVVDGADIYTFTTPASSSTTTYAPWGGQPIGATLTYDSTNHLLTLTDPAGDVTVFYDVDRDSLTGNPIIGALPSAFSGKFKSYTTADGSVSVTTSYDVDGNLQTMTRSDSVTSESEEWDFTYSSITNDLVTAAGGTPPEMATNIAWKQNGAVIRQAVYDYYTGRLSDGMGGYVNDPNGRLGDLRTVAIEDGSGNIISQDYYRYYKLTGESTYTGDQGPTNDPATTGGPDPLQPSEAATYDPTDPGSHDILVATGLKTVVQGASFDRMAAAVANYQTASDSALQPYVDNFFNYERWGDHEGADGIPFYGAPGYSSGEGFPWRIGYRFGSQYRVTEEIAQGSGCSSCSGGEGTYKYEYAANYLVNQPSAYYTDGPGYAVIDYNTWRMKQTEFLPDDTADTWADNEREVIYTNEVGQPLLDDYVQVAPSPITITAMSDGDNNVVQVTAPSHGLSTGETVALTGVLPELFDGIFKVTVVDADTFDITLPQTYAGNASIPAPYVDSAYNGDAYASVVTSQQATYYRYDDEGRLIEEASPSAVTGYDDAQMDLVDAVDPNGDVVPMGLISPSQGQVQIASYAGWAFDGRAGIAANGSDVLSGGPDAPDGSQVGFLQDESVISQTVTGWAAGTYTLDFQAAVVPGTSSYPNEQLQVFVDGTPITFSSSSLVAPGTSYSSYTSDSFTVPAGVHQIRFVGFGDTTMGTAIIDQVSVSGTGAPTMADGSFETDSLGSGNSAINPIGYALTATSSTGGSVDGKMDEAFVQEGQNGTPIPQESFSYYAHTAGSATVFPIATDTVYGNTGGTDARVTRDSYTYFSGTNAIQSETTVAPPVTSSQNGPATSTSDTSDADTTTSFNDPEGRVIWVKDGGGFLTYTAYDDYGGGVTKFINDVNTSDTGDFTNLPTGWTTPTGGGLELITAYEVDALGRTTKETDPNGNITYTVYNDPNHQTRVYPGWQSTTGTATSTGTTTTLVDTSLTGSVNYVGETLRITAGTDSGQSKTVTAYNASTHTLTVASAFTSATTSSSQFILAGTTGPIEVTTDYRPQAIIGGQATSTGSTTTLVDTTDLTSSIQYIGLELMITAGTDAGQAAIVTAYNSSTHTLTFSAAFTSATDSTTQWVLNSTTNYDEALTTSAAPIINASGLPLGNESLNALTIQSLSREITNDAGQMIEEDDYFSLSGVTYSQSTVYLGSASNDSSSGNYSATTYHYNARGWQDIVTDPTGTINRTVFDGLGRMVSKWVGTDDTPGSGYWSPANNTSPSNMVDVQDFYYDQRSAAPSAPTLGETTGGSGNASVYYVEITYVTASGESAPSPVAGYAVDASDLLTVASPSSMTGVTGYNVYVGLGQAYPYVAGGPMMLQNSSPISIGTDWAEASSGLVAGPSISDAGTGDSNLTETIQHPGGSAAERVTLNLFDWRDRLIATKQGALLSSGQPDPSGETDGVNRLITYNSYDNLGEMTASYTYAGDAVDLSDFANWTTSTDSSDLRAKATQSYDDLGRVYLAKTYSVDPSSGTVGSSLATNSYYDHRGNVIETSAPGGIVTKHAYDGAGRDIKDSTTDGGVINSASATWANAGTTTNDVVIEQTLNTYDADGNLVETEGKQRFDNDATSSTGDLGGPSSGIDSRNYYAAYYYDAADRETYSVDAGTNGGSSWTRPSSAPSDSDTVLVTRTDYNSAGWVLDTVDPRGIASATFYDLVGRSIKTIAAWDGTSSSPTPTSSTNQITTYTFDGNSDVLTMTAVMPSGANSQTTACLYGTTSTSGVYSNNLLAKTEYPDPSTGAASTSSSNDESDTYNALGQKITYTDRNGTIHGYAYDVLGRLTADDITTFGTGVSTQTYGLAYSYNDAGLPFKQTSYSNSGLSTVENQVEDVYNAYGQLIAQYQATSGAVSTGSTPSMQYGYSQPTGTNYSRLTSMTYPNGRIEDYGYNSGIDTTISRISTIADDGGTDAGTVAAYTYLGLSTIVIESEPQAGIELTYKQVSDDTDAIDDGGDQYTGLDRFGRVIDQAYYVIDSSPDPQFIDRIQYGYDRDGNMLYSDNLVNSSFSELYHANSSASGDDNSAYDSLNRLTSFTRGTLTSSGNNGSTLDTITSGNLNSTTSVPNSNQWNYDALGNWTSSVPGGTSESNTFNSQNEETANGSGSLTYDNEGNTTTDQLGNEYTWDAWGHVIRIASSSNVTEEVFTVDALGRYVTTNNGSGNEAIYFSGNNVVMEQFSASVYDQFVYGLAYVNDVILRDRNADGNGSTGNLGSSGSGLEEREYAQHDKQFSTISLTNSSGSVIQRYAYDPYGTTTMLTASWAYDSTGGGTNFFLYTFQGMRILGAPGTNGLFFSNRRIYDATRGRWISQDGGYWDGSDLYQTNKDNPMTYVDPIGNQAEPGILVSPTKGEGGGGSGGGGKGGGGAGGGGGGKGGAGTSCCTDCVPLTIYSEPAANPLDTGHTGLAVGGNYYDWGTEIMGADLSYETGAVVGSQQGAPWWGRWAQDGNGDYFANIFGQHHDEIRKHGGPVYSLTLYVCRGQAEKADSYMQDLYAKNGQYSIFGGDQNQCTSVVVGALQKAGLIAPNISRMMTPSYFFGQAKKGLKSTCGPNKGQHPQLGTVIP
jgi:YD repeat-containing protein